MWLRIYLRASELASWPLTVFWKHDPWLLWGWVGGVGDVIYLHWPLLIFWIMWVSSCNSLRTLLLINYLIKKKKKKKTMCLRIYSRVSELTSWLPTVFWKHDSWQSWLTFKWLAIVVITITHGPHIEDSQLVQWIWTADIREVETFHKIISWLFSFPN